MVLNAINVNPYVFSTYVGGSIPNGNKVYAMQVYVIKFVSNLQHMGLVE